MTSLEEDLDLVQSRIVEIEKNITILNENCQHLADHMRETQRFLVKLAHNQAEITKRLSQWPYIAVERGREQE